MTRQHATGLNSCLPVSQKREWWNYEEPNTPAITEVVVVVVVAMIIILILLLIIIIARPLSFGRDSLNKDLTPRIPIRHRVQIQGLNTH